MTCAVNTRFMLRFAIAAAAAAGALPGYVRITMCDAASAAAPACMAHCSVRLVPEVACTIPVASSGLGEPAIFRCSPDGHTVNATFFVNNRGVCDGRSQQWGGAFPADGTSCVKGDYLSYTFECVPTATGGSAVSHNVNT
eukprot:5746369-Prymnesium_polylepis.1